MTISFQFRDTHTHTHSPHHGHHVYDSHDTLTSRILGFLVIFYLVCGIISLPSIFDHLPALMLHLLFLLLPFFFLFIY